MSSFFVPPPPEYLDFGRIFHEMAAGFALHEMIFDEAGRPLDYRFLDVNPAYEAITGLKLAEVRGRRVREVLPDVEDRWIETYGRVVLTGEPVFFTDYAQALDKHFDVWAYRPSPARFIVMIQDVTVRVTTEATARNRERLFQAAIQTTSDGFFLVDSSGKIAEVNDAYLGMSGYSREEMIGSPLSEHELEEAPADVAAHIATIRELGHDSFDTRHRRKDGGVFDASMTVSYLEEDGGLCVSFCRDISARKAAEQAVLRQASILRAVLGSIDSAVAFKGVDGRYIGCNSEYERVFGTTEAAFIGSSDEEIFGPEGAKLILAEDREILQSRLPMVPDTVWRKAASGHDRLFERRKLPLIADGGEPFGIVVFWHDVSESSLIARAEAIQLALSREDDSSSSREVLHRAVDELEAATGSELGFFTCLEEGGSVIGCQAFSTGTLNGSCGLQAREGHRPLGDAGLWARCAVERRPLVIEDPARSIEARGMPPGHVKLTRVLLVPVIREEEVVGVLGIANKARPYNDWDLALSSRVAETVWEVFERKQAQEGAREIAIERDLAISAMRAGVETWFIEQDRKVYDRNWAAIVGYSLAELPADPMEVFPSLCHPDDLGPVTERLLDYISGKTDSYESEYRMRHKDGQWLWVLERGRVVERDPRGRPVRVSGLIIDISALKEGEARLRETLREKDILMQELFHRTKNTMQLINAMLELKKQGLDSSSFTQAIETVQGKIIAMSLVQEKLYRNGDLSVLDLGEYVAELIELIKEGAPHIPGNVSIRSETMAVPISVDAAIPCGLIVAELVSNALVHAFPEGGDGTIDVSVSRDDEGIYLGVSDDGVGLPADFDIGRSPRLGLRTVVGIGEEQLRGRVVFGNERRGFSCKLSFKDVYYPRRL